MMMFIHISDQFAKKPRFLAYRKHTDFAYSPSQVWEPMEVDFGE
jgi:hypothetical protein